MLNTKLLTPRNILVIAVFALAAQVILVRVNRWLHKNDAPATAGADA